MKKFGSGINIPDPQHCFIYLYPVLYTLFKFWFKNDTNTEHFEISIASSQQFPVNNQITDL